MYFANSDGVLQYNGVSWKLIRLPHRTSVQSIAMDREGRIMVGSDSEIGFLTETNDSVHYTSLTRFVPDSPHILSGVDRRYAQRIFLSAVIFRDLCRAR
jgi:hypothetical protein